jgi:ubiquinone/menaquinone biosynthesis C-methylase UbiE
MSTGETQDLDIYFDPKFAEVLETWGIDNTWREIQILLAGRKGRVLDVACGTGRTWDFLRDSRGLKYYGCDISDLLIDRAIKRGIPKRRLRVMDATRLDYRERSFEFVFSIGSLEHFTVDGIKGTLLACKRVSRFLNLHMVPVSASGKDEGWLTPYQSFWNNSQQWWLDMVREIFPEAWVMESKWKDDQSRGIWLICSDSAQTLR